MINYNDILQYICYDKKEYSIEVYGDNGVIKTATFGNTVDEDFTTDVFDLTSDEEATAFLKYLIIIDSSYIADSYKKNNL